MQAVCAKCSRLMCRAVVLFLVAECAQTTPMIAPLPGDPNFSIDGSVAFFKSGESNPTQPNPPPPPPCPPEPQRSGHSGGVPSGPPRLRGQLHRRPDLWPGWTPGQGSARCAPGRLQPPAPSPWEAGPA